ncbi:3-deoxy-7-phosphoheptulonate synthase [Alicyclobacillus ferrooxydans]|uniref:3-deoxy-7-phosphoheptulonate synthase n=1 Tax=Alicyclobacillus ferrooxydans TaxID=471514 RepID=UPI0009F8AEBD|nr:3-deoxy-7-phosphoheptulonate synthase [Alicyclobacillus ferrooxydans]
MAMTIREVNKKPAPYKLASRANHLEPTIVTVAQHKIGDGSVTVMAGPCSVESRDQIIEIARQLKDAGAHLLRGGAFKPRSSPYSFQGLGETGLKFLAEAREVTGLPVVSEVMEIEHLPMACEYIDMVQIGARNMQNYPLLKAVGRTTKPVLLKRGLSATIEEWLMSAEYILSEGNPNVVLCERGIRTFETATRNTLDLNAVPVVKHLSHLPIIVDPSHGTGVARYVTAMSMAAVACGADGLILEAHNTPESALSDGDQSITPGEFESLMRHINVLEESCAQLREGVLNG